MQTIRVGTARFDAATGTFVKRVDVKRDGRNFCYPCRIEGPDSTPRDWIEATLTRIALRPSDTGRPRAQPR